MASNEHKNLQDVNRHNPKGFEPATNETVLSKSIGSGATDTDGNLVWLNKGLLGVTIYKMAGYCAATTNYQYGTAITDDESPYQIDKDFGSTSATGSTITPSPLVRMGLGQVVTEDANVSTITGWLTSNGGNVVTIALCKITPVVNNTSGVAPVVIDELTVTGLSNNNKLVAIEETTITASSITAGDIIFPMVKEASGGSDIYFNTTIKTYTY